MIKEKLKRYVEILNSIPDEDRANSKGIIRTLLGRKCRFDLWEPTQWGVHKPLPLNQAKVEYGDAIKRYGTYKALNRLIQGSSGTISSIFNFFGFRIVESSKC